MTERNVKIIVSYIVFVCLPVLGFSGILRIGRGLTAPVSVEGVWKARINSDQSASCTREMAPIEENSISIVQSGRSLVLALAKGRGIPSAGAIAGSELSGTVIVPAALTQDRRSDAMFVMKARIDSHTQPRTLDGTISPANVGACGPASFHATRQSTLK